MGSKVSKDTYIIVGVLLVVAVGYFFMNRPEKAAEAEQINHSHPEVEGMNQSAMTAMASLPTDYGALIQVGNQTMDEGNYPIAAEAYKRALAINGDSPDVRSDYGACLHGMGLEFRALEEFRTVLDDYPDHPIATFNMGIVYYNEQKLDSAKVYWEKYLTLEPESQMANTVKQYLQQIGG